MDVYSEWKLKPLLTSSMPSQQIHKVHHGHAKKQSSIEALIGLFVEVMDILS